MSLPGPNGSLGEMIAAFRRRRHQVHRDVPWSQEDLAFASGIEQAHVSRIESNRQHPEYSTLVRICDALALSQTERAYVLARAGYQLAPPLPDEASVARVLSTLSSVLDSYAYPVVLLDEGERTWYFNTLVALLWGSCYGATDRDGCLARVRGRRIVELLFDPDLSPELLPRWKATYENIEQVLTRNISLFWRAHRIRLQDPDLNRILDRLRQNPDFVSRWERVERGDSDLLFIDHATYATHHPELGHLQWHAWRTRPAIDERFIVCHFSPVDGTTSRVLKHLVELPTVSRQRVEPRPP
jgi:transcriptional regulator with XRE-family HTH domain